MKPKIASVCVGNTSRSQMAEGVECPPLGEKNRVDWGFPDLDGTDLEALKTMRDQIGVKVTTLRAIAL